MNERCDRTPPLTPPLRGGSFPLPSGGDRLKTSVFTRPLKRDSSRDSLPSLETEVVGQAGSFVFNRADGTLVEHAVTSGRSAPEQVDSVASYTGSAFRLPPGAEPLLTLKPSFVSLLPDVAWQFSEATQREQVGGWSQGGVLRAGQGRVAVFGDVWIVLEMVGYDGPGPPAEANNPQLLLNVLHWFSGLLDE